MSPKWRKQSRQSLKIPLVVPTSYISKFTAIRAAKKMPFTFRADEIVTYVHILNFILKILLLYTRDNGGANS